VAEEGLSLMPIDVVAEAECVRCFSDQVRKSVAALVQWQQPEIGPVEFQKIECDQVGCSAGFWRTESINFRVAVFA
jgi:hypothetical protein